MPVHDSYESTKELLSQYQHRLLALEIELKESARVGEINRSLYIKRYKKLKVIQRTVDVMLKHFSGEHSFADTTTDTSLPIFDQCGPPEIAACQRFVDEKRRLASDVEKKAFGVMLWCEEAIAKGSTWLKGIMRLSRLQAFIRHVDHELSTIQRDSAALDRFIESIVKKARLPSKDLNGEAGTIGILVELFTNLNNQSSKILNLRSKVKAERIKNIEMRQWLLDQEQGIRQNIIASPPPTPLAIAQALRGLDEGYLAGMSTSKRRLILASRFYEDVLSASSHSTESPAKEVSPPSTVEARR